MYVFPTYIAENNYVPRREEQHPRTNTPVTLQAAKCLLHYQGRMRTKGHGQTIFFQNLSQTLKTAPAARYNVIFWELNAPLMKFALIGPPPCVYTSQGSRSRIPGLTPLAPGFACKCFKCRARRPFLVQTVTRSPLRIWAKQNVLLCQCSHFLCPLCVCISDKRYYLRHLEYQSNAGPTLHNYLDTRFI